MGFLDGLFGGGGRKNQNSTSVTTALPPIRLPDYPEAEGARGTWWDTLKKWETQPGYGAIAPNWNDIWDNARGKVQRYFMGGEEGPGAIATVRANLARKNMSDNPAAETAISRLGMKQGNLLSDIALEQSTKEAEFSEMGRQNWMEQVMRLANLKPQYMSGGSVTSRQYEQPGMGDYLGEAAGALAQYYAATTGGNDGLIVDSYGGGGGGGGALDGIMSMFGSGDGGDTGIGDILGSGDGGGGGTNYMGILSTVMDMFGNTSYENTDGGGGGSISVNGSGAAGGGSNAMGMLSSVMNMFGNSGGSSSGGGMTGGGGAYSGILSMVGNMFNSDSGGEGDEDGGGGSKWGGAISGGVSGAQLGSQIMPGWGTVIGGILGAVLGYFTSD